MNLYTAVHTGNIRGFHFRFRTGSLQAVTVRAVNDGLSGFAGALTRYSSTSWGPAAPWVPRTCHADARTCWCVKHWKLLTFFLLLFGLSFIINFIEPTKHFKSHQLHQFNCALHKKKSKNPLMSLPTIWQRRLSYMSFTTENIRLDAEKIPWSFFSFGKDQ